MIFFIIVHYALEDLNIYKFSIKQKLNSGCHFTPLNHWNYKARSKRMIVKYFIIIVSPS